MASGVGGGEETPLLPTGRRGEHHHAQYSVDLAGDVEVGAERSTARRRWIPGRCGRVAVAGAAAGVVLLAAALLPSLQDAGVARAGVARGKAPTVMDHIHDIVRGFLVLLTAAWLGTFMRTFYISYTELTSSFPDESETNVLRYRGEHASYDANQTVGCLRRLWFVLAGFVRYIIAKFLHSCCHSCNRNRERDWSWMQVEEWKPSCMHLLPLKIHYVDDKGNAYEDEKMTVQVKDAPEYRRTTLDKLQQHYTSQQLAEDGWHEKEESVGLAQLNNAICANRMMTCPTMNPDKAHMSDICNISVFADAHLAGSGLEDVIDTIGDVLAKHENTDRRCTVKYRSQKNLHNAFVGARICKKNCTEYGSEGTATVVRCDLPDKIKVCHDQFLTVKLRFDEIEQGMQIIMTPKTLDGMVCKSESHRYWGEVLKKTDTIVEVKWNRTDLGGPTECAKWNRTGLCGPNGCALKDVTEEPKSWLENGGKPARGQWAGKNHNGTPGGNPFDDVGSDFFQWIPKSEWGEWVVLDLALVNRDDYALIYTGADDIISEFGIKAGDVVLPTTHGGQAWWQRQHKLCRAHIEQEGVQHDIVRKMGDKELWWVKMLTRLSIIVVFLAPVVAIYSYLPVWVRRLNEIAQALHVTSTTWTNSVNIMEQESSSSAGILANTTMAGALSNATWMCDDFHIVASPELFGAVKIAAMNFIMVAITGVPPPAGVATQDWEHEYLAGSKGGAGTYPPQRIRMLLPFCQTSGQRAVTLKRFFALYQIISVLMVYVFAFFKVLLHVPSNSNSNILLTSSMSSWDLYQTVLIIVCLDPAICSIAQFAIRLIQSGAWDNKSQEQYRWFMVSAAVLAIYGVPAMLTHAGPMLGIVLVTFLWSFISPVLGILSFFEIMNAQDEIWGFDSHSLAIESLMGIVGIIEICFAIALLSHSVLYWPLHSIYAVVRGTGWCQCCCGPPYNPLPEGIGPEGAWESNGQPKMQDGWPAKLPLPKTTVQVSKDPKVARGKAWAGLEGTFLQYTGRSVAPTKLVWMVQKTGQQQWRPYTSKMVNHLIPQQKRGTADIIEGRLRMMLPNFWLEMPSTLRNLLWTTATNFLLQIFVLYAVLCYTMYAHGYKAQMNQIPTIEFNARSFGGFVSCMIYQITNTWWARKAMYWSGNL